MGKKNILFFMTDQFQWNASGYAGHPFVKTPNLDALAAKSVNFTNAFCASPVCVPARISLFSGQYPHKHGQPENLPVKEGTRMFAETLNDAGYHTAAVGKLHFMPPPREIKRFKTVRLHDGYDEYSAYVEYLRKEKPEYAPLDMHAYPKQGKEGVLTGKNIITGKEEEAIIFGTSKVPKEYFYTRFISDEAVKFLKNYNETNPFFLFVSFFGPHSPYMVPEPYDELYNPDDMPVPLTVNEKLDSKPKSQHFRRNLWGMEHTSVEQLKKITALYYAHITLIDEHIGRVVQALKENNLYDDTIIVFSADHGELLGNHGLFYKNHMYDEATHIPLLIHDTATEKPSKREELVSQIDIMPTLMDLTGLSIPEWNQGKSFRPAVEGKQYSGREEVFFEIRNSEVDGYISGCRDKEYLFSYEKNSLGNVFEGELYDTRKDTAQVNNLYHRREYSEKVSEFKNRLLNWFLETQ
ncbi:MAG: sulfatase-like hydrolase/transferase [Candidatus Omnitrophica bacterium]|nr:sulfatase-like hydrolase/transferase [Candidatus Omnitrophota bacterium]